MRKEQMLAASARTLSAMSDLTHNERVTTLCGLLTQEICFLPPGDRLPKLAHIVLHLPGILRTSEEGMRKVLVENARQGK